MANSDVTSIPRATISSHGEYIAITNKDDSVELFTKDSTDYIWNLTVDGQAESIQFSEDQSRMIVGTYNDTQWSGEGDTTIYSGSTFLYDLSDQSLIWEYTDTERNLWASYSLSDDGRYIAKCDWDSGYITLFNDSTSIPMWQYQTNAGCFDISISSDGGRILAGSGGSPATYGTVYLWDLESNDPIWTYDYPESQAVFAVEISDDGRKAYVGGAQGTSGAISYFYTPNKGDDAWLNLELISWQGNSSTTWDTDGTDMDVQFQVCIDLDGESDGISPLCKWTEVWNNTLTLSNAWETVFDLIEDNTTLNITIECWDNDDENDEWGNGPDACDMNPDDDEWRLYYEANWSNITTETFSGDGSIGNDTQWGNAESTWKVTVSYYGDEDNDLISDNIDFCGETSQGDGVDESGCSVFQYDWDADGIENGDDNCPTLHDTLCTFTDNYIDIGYINLPVKYPFMQDRNPLDSLVVSPNGKILSIFSQASQFSCIKSSAIYLLSLDDMSDTIQLDGPNCPSSSELIGVVGESRSSAGMTFSQNSEFFVTSWPQGISIFNAESPGDESLIDEDGNELSTAAEYYYDNGNTYPAARAILIPFGNEVYGPDNGVIKSVSISQNNDYVTSGGKIYHLMTGDIVANSSSITPYSENGDHYGQFLELNNILLRPDGLSAKATNDRIEIYNLQNPESIIQSIDFSNNIVQIQSVDDGNSLIVLSGNETESVIHHVNLQTGNTEEIFDGLDNQGLVKGIHVSKNGLRVVAVYEDNSNNHGIKVFERDADSDGVTDSKDLCPLVFGGFSGCLEEFFDTDEDGINDKDDQCPGTIDGINVDSTGCALNQLDSDGDGISDATDQCPNTPAGDSVGLTGCSGSQVDSDGDGIYDSQDNCPNTPSGTTVDSTGCAPDDVVDLDSDGDGVRDSVDACPNSATGIIVDPTGCETSGDVQELDDGVSTDDSSDALYGFIGLLVVVGIIAAAVAGIKSLFSSSDDDYDWDYDSYSSVSSHTNPTPQPEPNLELQNVVAELERQRMQSEREMKQLRQQQAQQSSASEIAAMQREMQALQQRVADSEQAKLQLQNEIEQVKIQKDESVNMQDSVVGGDMVASGGQKIESQTNVTGADPEAIARIIFEAQEKERERMRKERND